MTKMETWLSRLMWENTCEMDRLMREARAAKDNHNFPLLKQKLAGLRHAIDVGDRLVQVYALWKSAGRVDIKL